MGGRGGCSFNSLLVNHYRNGRGRMAVRTRLLHSKHRLQNAEHLIQCAIGENAQALDQPISIDSPDLIKNHVPILALKATTHTERIWVPTRCQRCNNKRTQMGIQFIWRDDNAWSRFSDFRSTRGVEGDKIDVTPRDFFINHHDHSSSSKRVLAMSSRRPSGAKAAADSAQPALGWDEGLMVSTPGAASISTSSVSPATSSKGFASLIPRELPILTSFARTMTTPDKRGHIVDTSRAIACSGRHWLLSNPKPLASRGCIGFQGRNSM